MSNEALKDKAKRPIGRPYSVTRRNRKFQTYSSERVEI